MRASEKDIIGEILKGNNACLEHLYRNHRNAFIQYAYKRFGVKEELAKDAFQDAILDFHQNVCQRKLTVLTCKVETYLFQIGTHKVLNLLKKEQRLTYNNDLHLNHGKEHDDFMNEERLESIQEQIAKAMENIPEDCRKVLKLYYYHGYDMDSIAREMGYKNADTAKTKKSVSMKKLLEQMKKMTLLLVF